MYVSAERVRSRASFAEPFHSSHAAAVAPSHSAWQLAGQRAAKGNPARFFHVPSSRSSPWKIRAASHHTRRCSSPPRHQFRTPRRPPPPTTSPAAHRVGAESATPTRQGLSAACDRLSSRRGGLSFSAPEASRDIVALADSALPDHPRPNPGRPPSLGSKPGGPVTEEGAVRGRGGGVRPPGLESRTEAAQPCRSPCGHNESR